MNIWIDERVILERAPVLEGADAGRHENTGYLGALQSQVAATLGRSATALKTNIAAPAAR
ncbi:MAG: hypothetical protein AAFR01_12415 [Pseudomonadota bacterium]